jgi:uracil-DNA glycosylase
MRTYGIEALEDLYNEYQSCTRCPALCDSRTNIVFGGGSASAPIMVIGEAPGEQEDMLERTFLGPSGRLFMDLLKMAWPPDPRLDAIDAIPPDDGPDPAQTYFGHLRDYLDNYIFWCNAVCCRPVDHEGKNRPPSHSEVGACSDRLERTIYAVDPLIIFALGKPAVSALLGRSAKIMEKRGSLLDVRIKSPVSGDIVRYPALALLHPSFLLRKGDKSLVPKKKGTTYATLVDMQWAFNLLNDQYQDMYSLPFPLTPERL